jgi:molybdenum cofactor guanylyltransferase
MGRDKGLLLKGNTPWAIYMAEKLTSFHLPLVFSINQQQWEAYSALIPPGQLIIDSLALPGPLNGLLSVHKKNPGKDLLLVACDMIDLDNSTIRKMIETYSGETENPLHNGSGEDFFVYREGDFVQPFCAIYTSGGLSQAYEGIGTPGQCDFSFQGLLGRGKTRKLAIDRPEAFKNYNSL